MDQPTARGIENFRSIMESSFYKNKKAQIHKEINGDTPFTSLRQINYLTFKQTKEEKDKAKEMKMQWREAMRALDKNWTKRHYGNPKLN